MGDEVYDEDDSYFKPKQVNTIEIEDGYFNYKKAKDSPKNGKSQFVKKVSSDNLEYQNTEKYPLVHKNQRKGKSPQPNSKNDDYSESNGKNNHKDSNSNSKNGKTKKDKNMSYKKGSNKEENIKSMDLT